MSSDLGQTLLYFCPASTGGIAEYAHHQCEAVAKEGHQVTMLCPDDYPHNSKLYSTLRSLRPSYKSTPCRACSRVKLAYKIIADMTALNFHLIKGKYRGVLFATYSEYLAPLWAWTLRFQSRRGVKFAAILHDPVRNYVVGPRWWHDWSVRQGFSFLKTVFVHSPVTLALQGVSEAIDLVVIPHGPYPYPESSKSRGDFRKELGTPEDVPLLLSFGHLRDNKNLDLILKALINIPEAHLLVAGSEAPPGQKQSSSYQALASELDLSGRCHWFIGHQESEMVANSFNASDIVLLMYSASFTSASGVMNVAAHYGVPIVASCGGGPVADALDEFLVGELARADDKKSIEEAVNIAITRLGNYSWKKYRHLNSWTRNAKALSNYFL